MSKTYQNLGYVFFTLLAKIWQSVHLYFSVHFFRTRFSKNHRVPECRTSTAHRRSVLYPKSPFSTQNSIFEMKKSTFWGLFFLKLRIFDALSRGFNEKFENRNELEARSSRLGARGWELEAGGPRGVWQKIDFSGCKKFNFGKKMYFWSPLVYLGFTVWMKFYKLSQVYRCAGASSAQVRAGSDSIDKLSILFFQKFKIKLGRFQNF